MIPAAVREVVYDRDDRCCFRCGVYAYAGSVHHRKNASQGGRSSPCNLVVLCGSGTTGCHGWVTTHPIEAIREGLTVPSYGDPLLLPVLRYASDWRFLTDDGEVATERRNPCPECPNGVVVTGKYHPDTGDTDADCSLGCGWSA